MEIIQSIDGNEDYKNVEICDAKFEYLKKDI
jgi:hypothetical protein